MSRFLLLICLAILLCTENISPVHAQNTFNENYQDIAQASKFYELGIQRLEAELPDSARYYLVQSLALYHKAKNRNGVLLSGIKLAESLQELGSLEQLLEYENDLESYLNETDSLYTHIKLSLGVAHFAKGNYQEALRYLKRSQDSFEDQGSNNLAFLLHIYWNQVKVYQKLGCPGPEIEVSQKIHLLNRQDNTLMNTADNIGLLIDQSFAYVQLYQEEKALQNLEMAPSLLKQLPKSFPRDLRVKIQQQLGDLYLELGSPEKATGFFKNNLQLLSQEDMAYVPTLSRFAKLAIQQGRYSDAHDTLAIVEELYAYDSLQFAQPLAEMYFLMGEVRRLTKNNVPALENYQKAFSYWVESYEANSIYRIPDLGKLPHKKSVYDALWLYAQTLANQARTEDVNSTQLLEMSLATYQRAMDLGDLIRKDPKVEEIELTPLDSLAGRFEGAIQVAATLFDRKRDDRFAGIAFQFQQRKKAEETRELFWDYYRKKGHPWQRDEQIDRRDYLVRLKENEEKLKLLNNKDEQELLRSIIDNLQQDYESFMSSLSYSHSAYFFLKNKEDYTDIDQLRKRMLEDEVMLSFFQGKKKIYIFELRKEKLLIHEQENLLSGQDGLNNFLKLVQDPQSTPKIFAPVAYALYKKLLLPSLLDTISSLMVVPDGVLQFLPFEALVSTDSIPETFSQLDYLIKKFPIRYLQHSAELLKKKEERYFARAQTRYAVFLPNYKSPEAFEWLDSLQLSPEQRVKASSPFFPSLDGQKAQLDKRVKLMKGDSFMNKNTTKQNFNQYASDYYSIEVAGYSLSTDYQPIQSGLTFSNAKEGEENFLNTYQILQKQLNNDLVVLSNHRVLGEFINGRGIKALTGSFSLAKCQNIAISLWQVEKNSNQELLTIFYRNLYAGEGKAHSLQEAKLSYLTDKNQSHHPYYWASIVLYGDNIELKGEERPWWSYGALLFALLMILIIIFGLRRRRR